MALDIRRIPEGVSLTPDAIDTLATRAQELLAAFRARINKLRQAVIDAQARFHAEAEQIVADAPDESKATAKNFAKQAAASKFSRFRINIVTNSQAERQELLGPLAAAREKAAFLLGMHPNAATHLFSVGLGTPEKGRYIQELEGAGPTELEHAIALAITTNNVVLASAICHVLDRRPKDRRPVSPLALAEVVWGKNHDALQGKLKTVIQAWTIADALDKEFRTGEATVTTNIKVALQQREIDALIPSDVA